MLPQQPQPELDNNNLPDNLAILLRLSQDELSSILQTYKIPRLPGFAIPGDLNEYHLQAASRSMLAHEVLVYDEAGDLIVAPLVLNIIVACVEAQQLLNLVRRKADSVQDYWFHMGSETPLILHDKPFAGVERFQAFNNGLQFASALILLLECDIADSTQPDGEDLTLPLDVYRAAYDAGLQGNEAQVKAQLNEFNPSPSLIGALSDPDSRNIITIASSDQEGQIKRDGFVGLQIGNGFWAAHIDSEHVQMSPMTAERFIGTIADFILELA